MHVNLSAGKARKTLLSKTHFSVLILISLYVAWPGILMLVPEAKKLNYKVQKYKHCKKRKYMILKPHDTLSEM